MNVYTCWLSKWFQLIVNKPGSFCTSWIEMHISYAREVYSFIHLFFTYLFIHSFNNQLFNIDYVQISVRIDTKSHIRDTIMGKKHFPVTEIVSVSCREAWPNRTIGSGLNWRDNLSSFPHSEILGYRDFRNDVNFSHMYSLRYWYL